MSQPLVSVCLPTYNYARFLPRAVESVLDQTFTDFELLVYDDASTDETVEVMQPYLSDPRVRLVVHERNQGLFANFNLSAAGANTPLVKHLCADDHLAPRCLESLVGLMEDPAIEIATCANWLIDDSGRITGEQIPPLGAGGRVDARAVARQFAEWLNVIGMPTNTLVRSESFRVVGGFDDRYAPAADVHLWLKLLARGDLAFTPEKLCFARYHEAKSHDYGADPSESSFLIWRDAPLIEGSVVSPTVAARGRQREAERVYLYAVAHALSGRVGRARELLRLTRGHVRQPWSFLRWLVGLPGIAIDQVRRIAAVRRGRTVIYDPRPHAGPPITDTE